MIARPVLPEEEEKRLLRAETVDRAHGRIEKRSIEMAPIRPEQTGWPHIHTACRIIRECQVVRRGEVVSSSREAAVLFRTRRMGTAVQTLQTRLKKTGTKRFQTKAIRDGYIRNQIVPAVHAA